MSTQHTAHSARTSRPQPSWDIKTVFSVCCLLSAGCWLLPTIAVACPLCKEALTDPGQLPQRLATAKAYAVSIGVLLTVPAALIGGISMLILRRSR